MYGKFFLKKYKRSDEFFAVYKSLTLTFAQNTDKIINVKKKIAH